MVVPQEIALCGEAGSAFENLDDKPMSDLWCTPGWKWAPGPQGPFELVIYGLGSPSISPASRDQVCIVVAVLAFALHSVATTGYHSRHDNGAKATIDRVCCALFAQYLS